MHCLSRKILSNGVPVIGTLKGYDQLMNLVLDDVKETMRGVSLCQMLNYSTDADHSQMMKVMRARDRWVSLWQEGPCSSFCHLWTEVRKLQIRSSNPLNEPLDLCA